MNSLENEYCASLLCICWFIDSFCSDCGFGVGDGREVRDVERGVGRDAVDALVVRVDQRHGEHDRDEEQQEGSQHLGNGRGDALNNGRGSRGHLEEHELKLVVAGGRVHQHDLAGGAVDVDRGVVAFHAMARRAGGQELEVLRYRISNGETGGTVFQMVKREAPYFKW